MRSPLLHGIYTIYTIYTTIHYNTLRYYITVIVGCHFGPFRNKPSVLHLYRAPIAWADLELCDDDAVARIMNYNSRWGETQPTEPGPFVLRTLFADVPLSADGTKDDIRINCVEYLGRCAAADRI